MLVQISAGQGPEECQLAVGKLFEYHPSDCMEAFSSHYSGVILQPDSMKVI